MKRDSGGNKTELVWWIGDTEAHYDGTGDLVHNYSHVNMGTPVARVDRTGNTTTNLEFQFHGLASSMLAAVDQSGTINASFDTAPFGETVESTDSSGGEGVADHPRRLNDKYVDAISDLGYYGARYYDRTAMAWTQSEPTFLRVPEAHRASPRHAQLYSFTLNNPLRYVDADGRDPSFKVIDAVQGTHAYDNVEDAVLRAISVVVSDTGTVGSIANGVGRHISLQGFSSDTSWVGRRRDAAGAIFGAFVMVSTKLSSSLESGANAGGCGYSPSACGRSQGLIAALVAADGSRRTSSTAAAPQKAFAITDNQTQTTWIAVDRILDELTKAGLNPGDPKDRDKIAAYLEKIIAHELGHDAGACHNKAGTECTDANDRSKNDMMHPDVDSPSSKRAKSFEASDIDKLADWSKRF